MSGRSIPPPSDALLKGRPLAAGYGEGTALIYHSDDTQEPDPRHIEQRQVGAEHQRLEQAIHHAEHDLLNVEQRVLTEIGEAESHIIAAHRALLADRELTDRIRAVIEAEHLDSESATIKVTEQVAAELGAADNEYLSERAHDIRDIKHRILKHLGHGGPSILANLPPRTILVARELLPSDTLNLDRAHVAAIVLEGGGRTSHAAILARAMGIPAVGSVEGALNVISTGDSLLVDGERGEVSVNPDARQVVSFANARRAFTNLEERLDEQRTDCRTRDGHEITLLANIGRPEEVAQVHRHHLAGIGLFRSEYLFLQSPAPPSLEQQTAVYRRVVQELGSLPLIIRTLDLGGDKQPLFPIGRFGGNPMFDMRGLRLSLHERHLFHRQLQAIGAVVEEGADISILFPMVVSADDLREAVDVVGSIIPRHRPRLGAMIETPSALFEIDDILEMVDYVSVGTNDLVQFLLAIERRSVETLSQDAFFQPAVLRSVAHVVDRARASDTPVTVCGEAAGDPAAAGVLVGMGISCLSVSPIRAARVRAVLAGHSSSELEDIAKLALSAHSRADVVRIVTSGPRRS
jgi:phosphotransferase system enzyme I (PtsI)